MPRDHPGMDRPTPSRRRPNWQRLTRYSLLPAAMVFLFAWTQFRGPAVPKVAREFIVLDIVRQGEMIRKVRATGTLVPERVEWITASHDGRVEKITYLPGTLVDPEKTLIVLSNPELQLELLDARSKFKAAEAEHLSLVAQLDSQILAQRSTLAAVASETKQAELQLEVDRKLAEKNLIADLELSLSEVRVAELQNRNEIERQRLDVAKNAVTAQLLGQEASLEQAQALYQLRQKQVAGLIVKASSSGVIQDIPLQVGQRVSPGDNIALIVDTTQLIARLRVPETQASEILVGQPSQIDLRTSVVNGVVQRIDPAVREATVTIDVGFQEQLPGNARPDMNVDGYVEVERLNDVAYIDRPAFAQSNSSGSVFRSNEDTGYAIRVPVTFGKASIREIQIIDGVAEGDKIIVSDVSNWDAVDRIELQ